MSVASYPTAWELITPKIAAMYLTFNTNNRQKNPRSIAAYTRAMLRGEWKANGDAIRFDVNGALLNGQHTLEAIIRSGTTQLCLVVRGLPNDVFPTIDGGGKRSSGDVLGLAGFKNRNSLSSVIGLLWAYETYRSNQVPPERRLTGIQYEQVAKAIPEISETVNQHCSQTKNRFMNMSVGAMLNFAIRHVPESKKFWSIATGDEPATKKNPAFAIRERWVSERGAIRKTQPRILEALTIKAWNLFLLGREVGTLKLAPEESFPCITGYGDEISATFPEWLETSDFSRDD